MLLGSVLLDIIGQPTAADITLVGTIIFMALSARPGSPTTARQRARADASHAARDADDGRARRLIVSAVMQVGSAQRSDRADRPLDHRVSWSSLPERSSAATSSTSSGTWSAATPSVAREPNGSGSTPARSRSRATPEATPTKMRAGINDLVVVRDRRPSPARSTTSVRTPGGPLHEGQRRRWLCRVPVAWIAVPPHGRTGATRPDRVRPARL